MDDDFASYEGSSGFLRWWPKALLVAAFGVLYIGWSHSLQWATLFVVCAWVQARMLPWRFRVLADGVDLVFPFGRRLFLPKSATTVRLESVGAVAMTPERRRFGYLLQDGVLYVPDRRLRMQRAFAFYGYHVV
jgi:hypothetical protein